MHRPRSASPSPRISSFFCCAPWCLGAVRRAAAKISSFCAACLCHYCWLLAVAVFSARATEERGSVAAVSLVLFAARLLANKACCSRTVAAEGGSRRRTGLPMHRSATRLRKTHKQAMSNNGRRDSHQAVPAACLGSPPPC